MVNTAQSIMNWMTFQNSPTWFWLHAALKPTYNSEASAGYSLGFWRPYDDDDFTKYPNIAKGHWDYNPRNFNGIRRLREIPAVELGAPPRSTRAPGGPSSGSWPGRPRRASSSSR